MKRSRRKEDGWAMLTILLFCAVFVIGMATALPIGAFEARRQREMELMDRGNDYKRAIQLYYRKFKRYPTRIEDLENTNQIRFLRRRWIDPMTGTDEWRFIHMTAQGLLVDSVLTAPGGLNGATGSTGSAGSTTSASSMSSTTSAGQTQMTGLAPSVSMMTSVGGSAAGTSSGFAGQPTVVGAGIAGVASKSEKASILVYNTRQKYNEWEFIYDPRKDPLMSAQAAAAQGPAGQAGQAGATGGIGSPFGGGTQNPPNSTVGVPNMPPTTIPHP